MESILSQNALETTFFENKRTNEQTNKHTNKQTKKHFFLLSNNYQHQQLRHEMPVYVKLSVEKVMFK